MNKRCSRVLSHIRKVSSRMRNVYIERSCSRSRGTLTLTNNLGLLAVSFNKADLALPLFKTALEANPKIEQFWLSYIDALIKEKQFDDAKEVVEQAKKQVWLQTSYTF